MNRFDQAVTAAKKYLATNQRDITHGLEHHQDVWETCQRILKQESIQVNPQLLKVAAFWHDVVVGEEKWPSASMVAETCQVLADTLPGYGFSPEETRLVIESVRHHEFRDTPTTVEGMVLQDADKLDVLSLKRWHRTLDDFKKERMPKDKFLSYVRTFFKWVPILSATFHFQSSRDQANHSIEQFWLDPEWLKVVESLKLTEEYYQARVNMTSWQTYVMRLVIRLKNRWIKVRNEFRLP